MIGQTVGVGSSALVPFIAQMPGVMPLVFACCYQVFVYLMMFCLPAPGAYLPKVIEKAEIETASTVTELNK